MAKSLTTANDVQALLRARNSLLWIVTTEEARVERYLFQAALSIAYQPRTWDVAEGVAYMDGRRVEASTPGYDARSPDAVLEAIRVQATKGTDRGLWILRDLPPWLMGPAGASTLRQLKNLARLLPETERVRAQAVIIISPFADVPPELANHATVILWPLPDREEIASILKTQIETLPDEVKENAAPDGTWDAAVDAAVGLTEEEANACFAKSLVQSRPPRIDPVAISREKRRIISREKVLEWFDPLPGGLDAVGGLENLKAWLISRSIAYTAGARAYGLPAPRGALLTGISGCGKSLTAKAISTAWGIPLLRLDLGALKSKFVGDSEANLRRAFKVIEAMGRCVVWLDEIEKALQGATSGSADGGVSADALGAILGWMQERQGETFVVACCNDASVLPPEFLRKGRFDEVWWIDLPNAAERMQIIAAALRQFGRGELANKGDFIAKAAVVSEGFTGSEIAELVPTGLFTAFADNARELTAEDLIAAARNTTPLIKTAAEKITALRNWAQGRARFASREERPAQEPRIRALDLAQ